jgi:hypothetical protein
MSTTTESLRRAVAGLIGLAASEQQRLAVAADSAEVGSRSATAAGSRTSRE